MAYLDRAVERIAPAKLLALSLARGPLIEPAPGSNRPGGMFWPAWPALASRFLAFWAAFAFARWRALALVMSASPYPLNPATAPRISDLRPIADSGGGDRSRMAQATALLSES